MNFLKKNLIYIIFVIVITLVIISLIVIPNNNKNTETIPISSTNPTSTTSNSTFNKLPSEDKAVLPGPNQSILDKQGQEEAERYSKVGQLLNFLPYKGVYFSLSYNIDANVFELTMNQNNQSRAHEELNTFLKSHGIENEDWLKNVQIMNQP